MGLPDKSLNPTDVQLLRQHPEWLDRFWSAAEDRAKYMPQGLEEDVHNFLHALLTLAVKVPPCEECASCQLNPT